MPSQNLSSTSSIPVNDINVLNNDLRTVPSSASVLSLQIDGQVDLNLDSLHNSVSSLGFCGRDQVLYLRE